MSAPTVAEQQGTRSTGVRVPWVAVAVLAVGMSFADSFWIVSLREAAGAAIRTGRPFASWLVDSTVVLPLFVGAVVAALAIAYRRYGTAPRGRKIVATGLLVALAGAVAALVVAVSSAGYDYYLQAGQADQVASSHSHGSGQISPFDPTCTGACAIDQTTLAVHAKGLAFLVPVLLTTNVLLVGWTVALLGGRLDAPMGGRPEPDALTH